VDFSQADRLLDPSPLFLETGVERLESGVLHVAARTLMHGCTGAMFGWWFGWGCDTQQYAWWHPGDHVSSRWDNWEPGRNVGSEHVVEERLGGDEVLGLRIQFRDPAEFYSVGAIAAARASGDVSVLVNARIGTSLDPPRDPDGRVLGGRLLHVGRDSHFGMVLRSHFFLGHDLAGVQSPAELAKLIPDEAGLGLLKHANTEWLYLAEFLPALYHAENRATITPPAAW
jgi:DAPG hydrolase PhiG domain